MPNNRCCNYDLPASERVYPEFCLHLMDDCVAPVVLGHDFLQLRGQVNVDFSGTLPPLELSIQSPCALIASQMQPPAIFDNLTVDCHPIQVKSRRYSKEDRKFIKSRGGSWQLNRNKPQYRSLQERHRRMEHLQKRQPQRHLNAQVALGALLALSDLVLDEWSSMGVVLPDVPCSPEHNCSQYDDDDLTCVDGQCVCLPHLCWVYHHESSAWVSRNVFTCGQCGQLGSSCYNSSNCDPPGECWFDNYCHCPVGENYNGICTVIDDSWAYKFTLAGFGIVFLVSLLLMLVHLYRNRSWNQHGPCCCCCLCKRRKDSGAASCEKSPAYTIRNHYLYNFNDEVATEAAASTSNPGHQPTGPRESNTRVENGSITSVETESTNISVSSVQNIQNRRETATNANLQDQVNPTTSTSIDMQRTAVPTTITSSEDGVEENRSADLIGNCHHERCGLCLPKGLSTRETNKNTDSPASGCSPPGTCTDSGCESFDGNLATYYNSEDECTSL